MKTKFREVLRVAHVLHEDGDSTKENGDSETIKNRTTDVTSVDKNIAFEGGSFCNISSVLCNKN